jgi:hypothetical protein
MKRLLQTTVLAVLTGAGGAAFAQTDYFGRSPVQWERLKFEVLKTEHFDIYYYDEGAQAAEEVGRLAERWYARLSAILDFQFPDRQPVVLYTSQGLFQQTDVIGGPPGEGVGGVTESLKRRIVLPVGASLAATDHVLGHELVHAFQYAMTGQGRGGVSSAALNMPLWFIEGMAEYLSVGPVDPHTSMWLREAALSKEKLPRISDLNSSRYFPYRWGQALWAYLAGRFGDRILGDALRKVGARTTDAEGVLKLVVGVDTKQLTTEWHAAVIAAVKKEAEGKQEASAYGPALVTEKEQGGSLNVGPALSPDGNRIAFLSERELFSVELFVADTRSGEVTKRLSQTVVDPHIESLQFIESAGAWDHAGRRFALAQQSKGRPLLVVLDGATGRALHEVPFPTLGEIATPSFAPDGRRIVFSGLFQGHTDLYVYDLESRELTALTRDAFADLQPSWSPDGRTIAFVTDRFTTRLETLAAGDVRLAALDVATREVAALPSFRTGKHINPQWSPEGDSLYFISDTSGISNVYRLAMATGERFQVTDLKSGASGITAQSPALSVAAADGRVAYSVYADGRYEIYAIEDLEKLAGTAVPAEDRENAGLIPGARPEGRVVAANADTRTGLADADTFRRVPYKAKFGLDAIGQPYVAAGIGGGTGAFAGGIAAQFSDMLGEHTLQTQVQAQSVSGFNDLGAVVGYVNRQRRLNWGAQVAQVPYITQGYSNSLFTTDDGQLVFGEQVFTDRQMERSVAALGYYPFNPSLRFEVEAGFRHLSYDSRVESEFFTFPDGVFIERQEQDLDTFDSLSLGFGTLALVHDTSLFGATSPILGRRFRFDVSPMVGTVDYAGVLGDFRQYVMPVRPVTLAGRVMHYGRYGGGGEDPRLFPLFLGDPGLVRGYSSGSFQASECGTGNGSACPVFDQLLGSRMAIANFEVRAPLFALFGARNLYGPLPIEVGAFFDAGVAWRSGDSPRSSNIVKSVGLVARVNLLGFLVLEGDWVRPLDRPGRGSVWQLNLLPGF